jgi:hypothetical protein
VTLVTSANPQTIFAENWPMLLGMALVLLFARPAAFAQDGTLNRPLFLIQVKRGRFTQVD